MRRFGFSRSLQFRPNFGRNAIAAWLAACILSLWVSPSWAHALDPKKRISQYIHTSWRVRDGSAPHAGYAITQTTDGFLWFVSGDMMTFDGVRFVNWDGPPNGASITKDGPFGQIVTAFGDHEGGLWVFGLHGLVHLKGSVVTAQLDLEGLGNLQDVSEDNDGSIWVVRGNNSISDQPLCHVTNRAVKCFGKADGIPIAPINAILADGKGGFWLGGQTALVHWHEGSGETYPIKALESNAGQPGIAGMALAPDGTLWLGILAAGPGRGLGRFINGLYQPFVTAGFDGSNLRVHDMIVDHDGNLWVGTRGSGLFRLRGNVVEHFGRADGLASDSVDAVFVDKEGTLWVASSGIGIDKFRDPAVANFSSVEGLGNDSANGVLAAQDGSVWVANVGSLDHIESNGSISSIRVKHGLPGDRVTSMLRDHAGNMWVGIDDGLYLFKNARFQKLPTPDNKPLGLVVGLTEDSDGNVWAECFSNPPKLIRIRDFRVQEEFPDSKVPSGRTLAADPHGGIWIGTLKGDLVQFRNGAVQSFALNTKGDPFSHQIIVNTDGAVLAGSADGLVGLRQGKVQRLTTKNGLPCNFVTSFIQDREKRWWLYTYCGIVELQDAELQRWWSDPDAVVQLRVFDELDGSDSGRPLFNSAAYGSDGRVWFARGISVQMLDPSRLPQQASPAVAHIQSFLVDRKDFSPNGEVKLPPRPRDLQIDYTAPVLSLPQRVKFRYRLQGYDRDWHDADTRRQAFYTDLPPGKYSFQVIARNSDGVWNYNPAILDFSVAPAWYQTIWFRTLCAFALLATLWAGHRLRVRQLARQFNMTLDARVAERTRIARELHDTLLQSFHGLLMKFQTALRFLPERPVEARAQLEGAIEQAEEAIIEGRDAVQGLRASTLQGNDLAEAISMLGEELASGSADFPAPSVRVAVEGQPQDLHPILRDEIYRIAAEALRNAFRHAHAQHVEVEIRYDQLWFQLRVRDDGQGFDPAAADRLRPEGHYGLRGMQERARIAGGKLTIWSELSAGTELELQIPAARAYVKAKRSWFAAKLMGRAAGRDS